jgi:hypothetical protein
LITYKSNTMNPIIDALIRSAIVLATGLIIVLGLSHDMLKKRKETLIRPSPSFICPGL